MAQPDVAPRDVSDVEDISSMVRAGEQVVTEGCVTAREAAAQLGCTLHRVYHLVREGALPAAHQGQGMLIASADLDALAARLGIKRQEDDTCRADDDYMDVDEAIRALGASRQTICRWCRQGDLEATKDRSVRGSGYRIAAASVRALRERRATMIVPRSPGLIPVEEAARRLGLSRNGVYSLVRLGVLESERVCGVSSVGQVRTMVREVSAATYLARHAAGIAVAADKEYVTARATAAGIVITADREYVTARAAAAELGVSNKRLYKLIDQGDVPVTRVGSSIRPRVLIARADLDELRASRAARGLGGPLMSLRE